MALTLKEEVLQMTNALHEEEALALLKAEIENFDTRGELDVMDELSPDDKTELLELIHEPDAKTRLPLKNI